MEIKRSGPSHPQKDPCKAAAGPNVGANPRRKSVRAMSCGVQQAKSIGMAQPPTPRCRISRSWISQARRLGEKLDGKGVDWLEKVTDEQYLSVR